MTFFLKVLKIFKLNFFINFNWYKDYLFNNLMKTEKKKKKYDLNTEIKELTNWEASGYKLLVETMAGFKYTIKIKIDPSLLDQNIVKYNSHLKKWRHW